MLDLEHLTAPLSNPVRINIHHRPLRINASVAITILIAQERRVSRAVAVGVPADEPAGVNVRASVHAWYPK